MATNTAAVLPPARQDPRQVVNTLKQVINWNDAGVAAGVAFDNALPAGAAILDCLVEIVTPFNGTAPVLTVGTVSTAYNNIVAAADVDETVAGTTRVTRGLGGLLARAADVAVYTKLALTSASAGQAIIIITFEGGASPS
jgi:hypothetical protein